MDEVSRVSAPLKSKPLASMEGVKGAQSVQTTSELQELKEVQAEISHALNLMNEIREKLEVAYRELSPD
ncbi:MAG: hypothetical protein H7A36_07470 [Chlamydiales bacterium]|nr:hypothetical protein [Chlamydiales bacterium]